MCASIYKCTHTHTTIETIVPKREFFHSRFYKSFFYYYTHDILRRTCLANKKWNSTRIFNRTDQPPRCLSIYTRKVPCVGEDLLAEGLSPGGDLVDLHAPLVAGTLYKTEGETPDKELVRSIEPHADTTEFTGSLACRKVDPYTVLAELQSEAQNMTVDHLLSGALGWAGTGRRIESFVVPSPVLFTVEGGGAADGAGATDSARWRKLFSEPLEGCARACESAQAAHLRPVWPPGLLTRQPHWSDRMPRPQPRGSPQPLL